MADLANVQVMIDLSDAEPDLEVEALEELTRNLKQEIEEQILKLNQEEKEEQF